MNNPYCVNVLSSDFLQLQKDTGLSTESLKNIVFTYQNSRNTDNYPTKEEVLQSLEGINHEYSEAQMSVWNSLYSKPIILNNDRAAQTARNGALKYFPKEAVTLVKNTDGKFTLRVAKPTTTDNRESGQHNDTNATDNRINWAVTSNNGYEVSSAGDKRFSALNATFAKGTTFMGEDIGGYSIEEVYQTLVKQGKLSHDWKSGKGKVPADDSILVHNPVIRLEDMDFLNTIPRDLADAIAQDFTGEKAATKEQLEDYSYYRGYRPLWELWASQNPELMQELREKSQGKTLTDKFANTRVSQARALSDILNKGEEPSSSHIVVDKDLKQHYQQWQQDNPTGIVAYRVNFNMYNTPSEALAGRIGNPFSEGANGVNKGIDTVEKFKEWLLTGNNFGEAKATEEYRQAIIQKILSTPNNSPVLYYTDKYNRATHADIIDYFINHKQELENNENGKNDFTRLQEESRGMSEQDITKLHSGEQRISEEIRSRFAGIFRRRLDSSRSSRGNHVRSGLKSEKHNTSFSFIEKVDPQLFHNIFEICRNHLKYGELVDLHESYEGVDCYISEDGMYGFAIEPDGNLVSVFNLSGKQGFLSAIKDYVVEKGATHLDGYNSSEQPLAKIYQKVLGWQTASMMDYNMDYDHDNIAANHGNPQVAFMVAPKTGVDVATRTFDKDSYDAAQEYQLSFVKQQSIPAYQNETKTIQDLFNLDGTEQNKKFSFLEIEDEKGNRGVKVTLANSENNEGISIVPVTDEQGNLTYQMDLSEIDSFEQKDQYSLIKIAETLIPEDSLLTGMMGITPTGLYLLGQLGSKYDREGVTEVTADNGKTLNMPVYRKKKATVIDKFITKQNTLKSKVLNLLTSKYLTNSEVNNIAREVAYTIGDILTEYQQNAEAAQVKYNLHLNQTQLDLIEIASSRTEVLNAIGAPALIDYVRELYTNPAISYTNVRTLAKAKVLEKNWEALIFKANSFLANREGFKLSFMDNTHSIISMDEVLREFSDTPIDLESVNELEGSQQEKWQIESRTMSAIDLMSAGVKNELDGLPMLQVVGKKEDGTLDIQPVTNEFGGVTHIPIEKSTGSLLTWFSSAYTLSEMVNILTEKYTNNPWVKPLIEKLNDKSGKYADFQSQFFTAFNLRFQLNDVITVDKETGRLKVSPINEETASSELIKGIKSSYSIGTHPLFNNGQINKTSLNTLRNIVDVLRSVNGTSVNSDTLKTLHTNIKGLMDILGVPVDMETIQQAYSFEDIKSIATPLKYFIEKLEKFADSKEFDPFAYNKDKEKNTYVTGNIKSILKPLSNILEETQVKSFFDSGKMYQSYNVPSYLTTLVSRIKNLSDADFQTFIQNEYGKFPWFRFQTAGSDLSKGWRMSWMRQLMFDKEARKVFNHKVNLNMSGNNYMRTMSPAEYELSILAEYFANSSRESATRVVSWFRVPILSNKPSSEFISFYSERGVNYKEILLDGFKQVFDQELSRIQTVLQRNLSKNNPKFIKNFDIRGREFCFLDYFNKYLTHSEEYDSSLDKDFSSLLERKLKGEKLSTEENTELYQKALDIINTNTERLVQAELQAMKDNGIAKAAAAKIQGLTKENVHSALENFLWNDRFAQIMIQELTFTDPAFYKDTDDIQKRVAQLHSPGTRPNLAATDYDGRPVTDGIQRDIVFRDFDGIKSSVIANIKLIFDRKIAEAPENLKEEFITLRDSVIDAYSNINVTDAQAYNCLSSNRKKGFMFGDMSRQQEEMYKRIKNGTYTFADLKTAFQPRKPFKYTQNTENMGEGTALGVHKMPVQNKNAEYLLFMADALMNTDSSTPNILRVISEIMEESHIEADGSTGIKGIDTAQFNSAVKSGERGAIDLSSFMELKEGETAADVEARAKKALERMIYANEEDIAGMSEEDIDALVATNKKAHNYNLSHVNHSNFENYTMQQNVPSHYKDNKQAQSSQERAIISSDLADTNPDGTPAVYKVEGRSLSKQEFRQEFEQTIADNIDEDIDTLSAELMLDNPDPNQRIAALSRVIQSELENSSRYGLDLWISTCVDPTTGKFELPLGDPIQYKMIAQLLNSIIKNRINKQKLPGGPIVQVSSFGSKKLHIRFKDKEGNILKTRDEYEGTDEEYQEYIRKNQYGTSHMEAMAPIYNDQLYEFFADENGNIDIEAIEATDPDLLIFISNRIPTEDKQSIEVGKIVGFLPKEAGDALMLPYELTSKDDSDFDVDKRYFQRKNLPIVRKPINEVRQLLISNLIPIIAKNPNVIKEVNEMVSKRKDITDANRAEITEKITNSIAKSYAISYTNNYLRGTVDKNAFKFEVDKIYRRVAFKTIKATEGRTYRDNKIIDMMITVMQHPTQAASVIRQGGFDSIKVLGYGVEAMRRGASDSVLSDTSSENKARISTKKSLLDLSTQIEYYRLNKAASATLGMFAVQKTAHAILEGDGLKLNFKKVFMDYPAITIAGHTIDSHTVIDAGGNENATSIGRILGSTVGASADAAKEPALGYLNVTEDTAGIFSTMLRFGFNLNTAGLFMSTSPITEMLGRKINSSLSSSAKSINTLIEEELNILISEIGENAALHIEQEGIPYEALIEAIQTPYKELDIKYKYAILNAYNKLNKITGEMKTPTLATRFNSISQAVGPLIEDNLVLQYKLDTGSNHFNYGISDILRKHPILDRFSKAYTLADRVFKDFPLKSASFREVLRALTYDKNYMVTGSKIMGDRSELTKLGDFFTSYILVQSKAIKEEKLKYYVEDFVKDFLKKDYYSKYPDNQFIQRLKLYTKNGNTYLNVETTGLSREEKDTLGLGWADLYHSGEEGRKLAGDLYYYAFFRRGIGFSPESFMSLLPVELRMSMDKYKDTFASIPMVNAAVLIDQFIRNNIDDNKLCPFKSSRELSNWTESTTKDGKLIYTANGENATKGVLDYYIKIKDNDGKYRVLTRGILRNAYVEIDALGSNKAYLEMSSSLINGSLDKSLVTELQEEERHDETPQTPIAVTEADTSSEHENDVQKEKAKAYLTKLFEKTGDPIKAIQQWKQALLLDAENNNNVYKDKLVQVLKRRLPEMGQEYTEESLNKTINDLNMC